LRTRPYGAVRAWSLWRATRRNLAALDPESLDEVLLRGIECWPVAWQLLRINPGIRVGSSLDADELATFSSRRAQFLRDHPRPRRPLVGRVIRRGFRWLRG
jgi:hypothetical protein